MGDYSDYRYLDVTVDEGVALIEITNREYTMRGHYELNAIWRDLDRDHDVRSAILTWAVPASKDRLGPHYPAEMGPDARAEDAGRWWSRWQWPMREAREGIKDLMESSKMVVSGIRRDVSYGAGLVLATVADVSIAATDAKIADRHVDAAMVAGDGAVHWMLSCGVQKAKLLALACQEISGEEAERIGLVSLSAPDDQVMDIAWRYARLFANGPQQVLNYTKRAFNQWLRLGNLLTYEVGNAYEIMNIQADPDTMVAAMWGKAEQGQPSGYDIATRPPLPSVSNPYGPDELP
jgi:enoyl-CoA hydratase